MASVASTYASPESRFERPSGRRDPASIAPVVLMVSGGADSAALLWLAANSTLDIADGRGEARIARERLHVLHVNHRLRGEAADADEAFVRELSESFGIPCSVERIDVAAHAKEQGDNVENMGRELRYAAADRLANELSAELGTPRSAARIVTAHTADDRAETFLMNAVKGAAASGLSSIPRRRNRIVRPLLDRSHEELCSLLRTAGIEWREDATNADTRYLRAFVRHEVLPVIRERNPRVVETLSQSCDILSDEDAYMAGIAARSLRELERRRAEGMVALDAARLAALDVAVARRVVRAAILSVEEECRLEARHIKRVLRLVAAGKGSATVPMGVDCRVSYGMLLIRSRRAPEIPDHGWLEVPALSVGALGVGEMMRSDGSVVTARLLEAAPGQDAEALARAAGAGSRSTVLLDAAAAGIGPAGGRLWVDTPQAGDVMCPLGMHGQSKKLSDLLGEARVPAAERGSVAVVRRDALGPVVWLAGIRADERGRCTSSTRLLLELGIRKA